MTPPAIIHDVPAGGQAWDAWLPAATEFAVYEGVRGGDEDAFRLIAHTMQPVLRRLAGVTTSSPDRIRSLVADNWRATLRALGMFHWHTPFATWVAAGLVQRARSDSERAGVRPAPVGPVAPPTVAPPGPGDWSDLPWSARWDAALPLLAGVHARLPRSAREVVHTHDIEGWPLQRSCDVLGVTAVHYRAVLVAGHRRLRDALAVLVGEDARTPWLQAQTDRVGLALRILHDMTEDVTEQADDPLDPRTIAAFRAWRIEQTPRWRRRGIGLPSLHRVGG